MYNYSLNRWLNVYENVAVTSVQTSEQNLLVEGIDEAITIKGSGLMAGPLELQCLLYDPKSAILISKLPAIVTADDECLCTLPSDFFSNYSKLELHLTFNEG